MAFLKLCMALCMVTIVINVSKVQSKPPDGCSCYNGTKGTFAISCDDAGCSRGDNDGCDRFSLVYGGKNRIRSKSGPFVTNGCNCPGFSYNGGTSTGDNGVSTNTVDTPISTYRQYTDCSSFDSSAKGTACCNYCCTLP